MRLQWLDAIRRTWLLYHLADPDFAFMYDPPPEGEWVALDTETTGLDVHRDQVVSIGAVRIVGNRLLTRLLGWVARAPISDGQSGYRALSWAAAADAEVVHDYNYAQVLTLDLLAKGYRYLEVPIGYRWRTVGRSFVRPAAYLRRVAPAVWRELHPAPARAGGCRTMSA